MLAFYTDNLNFLFSSHPVSQTIRRENKTDFNNPKSPLRNRSGSRQLTGSILKIE